MTADMPMSAGSEGTVNFFAFGPNSGCCGPSYEVPRNILINRRFCMFFPYLPGEVLSSREVVSATPGLQVRFL